MNLARQLQNETASQDDNNDNKANESDKTDDDAE